MNTLMIILVFAGVLAVLAAVVYLVFELFGFGGHADEFRDPQTGRRRWESPHLETRDEFEHTHDSLV